jgi:DNA-binding NarL/FixJ family response regulator
MTAKRPKMGRGERDYDLAILDLNLARDEGTQVLQCVRAKRRELPILVLSGRNRAAVVPARELVQTRAAPWDGISVPVVHRGRQTKQ